MLELGVLHNGASDLKAIKTANGVTVSDGSLADVHQSLQRGVLNQVRQGILADRLGYNYFFMKEHHFQPEGAEFSPNPLLAEAAIATSTRRTASVRQPTSSRGGIRFASPSRARCSTS